jgi:hypothetical protein
MINVGRRSCMVITKVVAARGPMNHAVTDYWLRRRAWRRHRSCTVFLRQLHTFGYVHQLWNGNPTSSHSDADLSLFGDAVP